MKNLIRLIIIGAAAMMLVTLLLRLPLVGKDLFLIGTDFGVEMDTVRFRHYLDGVLQGTERTRTSVTSWDTTIADAEVGEHRIIYYLVETPTDPALPWHWVFNVLPDSVPVPGEQIAVIAAETADSVLVDSSSYQGAASGLSAAEILDSLSDRGINVFPDAWWHNIALRADSGQGAASGLSAAEILDSLLDRGVDVFSAAWWHNVALRADSGAIGSSVWSTDQRDSLLEAATAASMQQKVWIDAATKELTALGFTLDTSDIEETFWAEIAARADSGMWAAVTALVTEKHDYLQAYLTIRACSKYEVIGSANTDVIIYIDTCAWDTLGHQIYYHLNGEAGDRPDSVKFFPGAPE